MAVDICLSAAEMATDLELGLHVSPCDGANLIRELRAEIVRLRGEVCSCPSGDGSLRWPCKAHPPGAIAPAEAKGCSCPRGASTMFTLTDTACPQHGTPQPAAQVQGEGS